MTQGEFAALYGILRVDVNAAVKRSKVQPCGAPKSFVAGRKAENYDEYDLAKAVNEYYRDRRLYYINKAQEWSHRANEIAEKWRVRKRRTK